ncbi:MAG: hypothetical protein HUJ31_14350, partial [Pseudomonadales bacterium]|nr:hypothetical protein [Pseudomonadales bacterium]
MNKKTAIALAAIVVGVALISAQFYAGRNTQVIDAPEQASAKSEDRSGNEQVSAVADAQHSSDAGTEVVPPVSGSFFAPPLQEHDPHDPYQSPFKLGVYKLRDVAGTYDQNIEAARQGESAAMREIAHVMLNCQHAQSVGTEEDALRYFEQAVLTQYEFEQSVEQIRTCAPVLADQEDDIARFVEAGYRGTHYDMWLRESAAAGNDLARVEHLLDLPGQSKELARLLDKLVDTMDPIVLDVAAGFVSIRSNEMNEHEFFGWQYLSCLNASICDAALYEAAVRRRFHQAEADEIIAFGQSFESLEQAGISFVEIEESRPYMP